MEKESINEFSKYPDDEFWIVSDVDDNLDIHKDEFENAIKECDEIYRGNEAGNRRIETNISYENFIGTDR